MRPLGALLIVRSLAATPEQAQDFIYDFSMQLGRVGAWLGGYGFPADDDRANARELERLGFGELWFGVAP